MPAEFHHGLPGFGCLVKVLAPTELAEWIQEELARATAQYGGDDPPMVGSDVQPGLPFLFHRLMNA